MEFRNATPTDLDLLAANSVSRGGKENPAIANRTFALEHEGQLLAGGGIWGMREGVAWVWFSWMPAGVEHKYTVYRVSYEWLQHLIVEHGLRRVMAAVREDFMEARSTVEHLGFKRESLMPRYFENGPAILYVLLP